MKIGLLTVPYHDRPLPELLPALAELGVEAIELGTGNYPGDRHCPLDELLDNRPAQDALLASLEQHGLIVSALSQHGNPLHPQPRVATAAHATWRATVALAEQLGVAVVNAFSGCPGDGDGARVPNWVTCAWPPEFLELLDWQWREHVIPYWREEADFAARHGVRVAIEMHPGFVVYNPAGLLRLRAAAGDNLGANFDPSHLFWQGIDPSEAIRLLAQEEAIFHVHAKDTELHAAAIRRNGVLDLEALDTVEERAWAFRTLGLGHDRHAWAEIVAALGAAGYDHVLSIEHEDERLDTDAALRRSVQLLRELLDDVSSTTDRHSADGLASSAAVADHPLLEGGTP
jgi:sugar phosphate isomerase/epimerase